MRDINRIDTFLVELGKQWKRYPDFRFMQMLMNIQFTGDPWYMEEDEFLDVLKKSMDKMLGEDKND